MFEDILKAIIWSLLPHKHAYSIKIGRFIRHFDRYGNPKGYTIIGFFGVRKRFDMNHNLVSISCRGLWGGYKTFDAHGNLISRSHRNFWGGFTTYNRAGKKIKQSYKAFWDDYDRFDADDPDDFEITVHIEPEHKLKNRSPRERAFASMEFTKESNYYDMVASIEKNDTAASKVKSDVTSRNTKAPEKKIPKDTDRKIVIEREADKVSVVKPEKADTSKVMRETSGHNNRTEKESDREEKGNEKERTSGSVISGSRKSSGTGKSNAKKKVIDPVLEAERKFEELNDLLSQSIDRTINYYESVKEYEEIHAEKFTKILAFSYQGTNEFPACVSEKNGKLQV